MTPSKPVATQVLLHQQALDDAAQHVQRLRKTLGHAAAKAWVDALQLAVAHISHKPNAGAAHLALQLNLPHLFTWPMHQQSETIWYIHSAQSLRVLRILGISARLPDPMTSVNAPKT
jgi:hypothetical protein